VRQTDATLERKWSMTRLGSGDYLLWSNDEKVLWRIHEHWDGRALGLEVDYELRRFWRLTYMTREQAQMHLTIGELPERWSERWRERAWMLPRRQDAIDLAMKSDAARMKEERGG